MANLQKILKVTQAQYNTLASGGTVGTYTGLDDNYLYLVKDNTTYITSNGGTIDGGPLIMEGVGIELGNGAIIGGDSSTSGNEIIYDVNDNILFANDEYSLIYSSSDSYLDNFTFATKEFRISDEADTGEYMFFDSETGTIAHTEGAQPYYAALPSSNGTLATEAYVNNQLGPQIILLTDNGSTTAGTWLARTDKITALAEGQIFMYELVVAGASTTKININNLGAKTIYLHNTTKLTTQYGVGQRIVFVYNGSTFTLVNGYDSNTNTYVRQYQTGTGTRVAPEYPILTRYNVTDKTDTYEAAYARYNPNTYINTSTGNIYAPAFYENGTALASKYLGINAKAADSDKLDGADSSYFINTSANSQYKIGNMTFYSTVSFGNSIPTNGDGSLSYIMTGMLMNRSTDTISGLYASSGQWNRFYGLPNNTRYICKCNYKGDNSTTSSTATDGMWTCVDERHGGGTNNSTNLGRLFDNTFTTGAQFLVSALTGSRPLQIVVQVTDGVAIDATDTNYLVINGWCYDGIPVSSNPYYGTLNSYYIELLLRNETTQELEWVKTFQRTNVQDYIHGLAIPLWSSSFVGANASKYWPTDATSYKMFFGIRLTVTAATAGTMGSDTFGITELKLLETRPAGLPSDGVGAYPLTGGTLLGDFILSSKNVDNTIRPEINNNGYLGTSSYQWKRIYGETLYENGVPLANKYMARTNTFTGVSYTVTNSSNTPRATMQFNESDDCVEFVFY